MECLFILTVINIWDSLLHAFFFFLFKIHENPKNKIYSRENYILFLMIAKFSLACILICFVIWVSITYFQQTKDPLSQRKQISDFFFPEPSDWENKINV